MRRLIPLSLLLLSVNAFAQGAVEYRNLKEVFAAGFYRLTCSDTQSPIQAHVYVVVEKDRVTELKILSIAPAESLNLISYSRKDLSQIQITEGPSLRIAGRRPGAYWSEAFDLNVFEDQNGSLVADLEYDDGEGMALERRMKCGAVTYVLAPGH